MYLPKGENECLQRKVVLCEHNGAKQYQIDDITFDITPKSHFFNWKNDKGQQVNTSVVDYYLLKYKVNLTKISD